MPDGDERNGLVEFHRIISDQLNGRLSESPRFFAVLVIIGTGYGYVLWHSEHRTLLILSLASLLAYLAVLWSIAYLAALGYAFRYLQNSQHKIEDALGWDRFRNRTTGVPPSGCSVIHAFWLLPGIYHAHVGGLTVLLLLIVSAFLMESNLLFRAKVMIGLGALIFTLAFVVGINLHYFTRYKAKRLPLKHESVGSSGTN